MATIADFQLTRNSFNIADIEPEAFGVEPTAANPSAKAGEVLPERVKPQIRQTKSHPNDIFRFTKEAINVREKKTQAEEMTDMMARDLCLAQDEAQEKGEKLRQKEAELSRCKAELQGWRKEARNLSLQILEEKHQIMQLEFALSEQASEVPTNISSAAESDGDKWQVLLQDKQLEFDAKLAEMEDRLSLQLLREQEQQRLAQAKLRETEERLQADASQAEEMHRIAEALLRSAKEQVESQMREAEERSGIQIAELLKSVQEAEVALQAFTNRMDVKTDQENLVKRIGVLEAEMQDQRQRYDWFKRNSERLLKDMKATQASKKALEQSEEALKRQLDKLDSQVVEL
jgi:hypothetical protein